MTVTVGPAGVLHPAAAAGAVEPAAAGADAPLEPAAADVAGLLPVELLELHAAAESTVAAATAKSAGSRLVLIDSPGGLWRE
jgi:hypothetical protein